MIHILLWAPQNGPSVQTQDIQEVRKALADKRQRFWLDLDTPTEEELKFLEELFHFHPITLKAVREIVGIPRIDIHENYLFLVLHRIFYHFESEKCELREFEVFVSDQFIITIHQAHLSRTFQITRGQVCEHPRELGQHGTPYVLFRLLSMAIQDYKPVLETWQDTLDEIEQNVFQNTGTGTAISEKILEFKKLVSRMRKSLLPERDVLKALHENKELVYIAKTRPYFKVVLDSMNALIGDLETLGEHTKSIFDIYATSLTIRLTESSHKLNYVMQRLTIAASIFLPLTFIVGIYGMNFEIMPELKWKWGYFLTWGVMLVVTGGMLTFFKRKKWL
ncbi:MAG: magnesium/cobalt transporter CorA [Deltaproteobacteria bacterium]|nr:magnesium/cobalt transporter CorA [Deltaproteobacteria bacterium]